MQLATNDLYQNFILLNPCDAEAVDIILKGDKDCKEVNGDYKSTPLNSKNRKSFQSPSRRSGGTAHRSHGKSSINEPWVDCSFAANDSTIGPEPHAFNITESNDGYPDHPGLDDSDENDDPWKPLNPHEAGSLKVKPVKKGGQDFTCSFPHRIFVVVHVISVVSHFVFSFQAVKAFKRRGVCSTKCNLLSTQFPLAKMCGPISSELTEIWEKNRACERQLEPQTPSLYEKVFSSMVRCLHICCLLLCCHLMPYFLFAAAKLSYLWRISNF